MYNQDCRDMVEELLKVDSGLTKWEIEFLDDMAVWRGSFTKKQKALIEKIWHKIFHASGRKKSNVSKRVS